MIPSSCVIVLVFGLGVGARVAVVTFFGVAEKDVKRLFGREVVVFRFVCVPDFGPASCGVFFHIQSLEDAYFKGKQIVD